MRWFLNNLAVFVFAGATLTLQLFINTILPRPFSTLNILIIALLGFLLTQSNARNSWLLALFLGFGMELLTSVSRGVLLASWLVTTILVFWLAQRLLTNRSLYIVLLLSTVAMIVFLGLQLLAQFIFAYQARSTAIPIHASEVIAAVWSFALTVIFCGLAFTLARVLIKRFNPAYVKSKR